MHLVLLLLALVATSSAAKLPFTKTKAGATDELRYSEKCGEALTAEVDCKVLETQSVASTSNKAGTKLTVEALDEMCTDDCKDSLATYRETVTAACSEDELDFKIDFQSGSAFFVLLIDYYIGDYMDHCLKDSAGDYCILKSRIEENVNGCDECTLLSFGVLLDNGFVFDDALMAGYANKTASCDIPGLRHFSSSAVNAEASTSSQDTVEEMVEYDWTEDKDDQDYDHVPDDAHPESTRECFDWFPPAEGETCEELLEINYITLEQFYRWNPSVKSDCSGLQPDASYCVMGDDHDSEDKNEDVGEVVGEVESEDHVYHGEL
ncbi:hypothetical protein BJX62DRAFT_235452 [Aspergillus germanicus]